MQHFSHLLFSFGLLTTSIQAALPVLERKIYELRTNRFYVDNPPTLIHYNPEFVLPNMPLLEDTYPHVYIYALIQRCSDNNLSDVDADQLINSLIATDAQQLHNDEFMLDVLVKCPALIPLLEFTRKPLTTIDVRLSKLSEEAIKNAQRHNIELRVGDDKKGASPWIPRNLLDLANDAKPLSGLLDVDIAIPTELQNVSLTLDGAFFLNGRTGEYASYYEFLNSHLHNIRYDGPNAQHLPVLKEIFSTWIQGKSIVRDRETRGLARKILTEPYVPLIMTCPSHVFSGLFYRDHENKLNLIICNRSEFSIETGCIQYFDYKQDEDVLTKNLSDLISPQVEQKFRDAIDALFGDHSVYNVLVPQMPQSSGSCYLQAGILLIKAVEALFKMEGISSSLVRMEAHRLIIDLFKKYPIDSPLHGNMMTIIAKCILPQNLDFIQLSDYPQLDPFFHQAFEPSMLAVIREKYSFAHLFIETSTSPECQLLHLLSKSDIEGFVRLAHSLNNHINIVSTKDRLIPYMQVLSLSTRPPIRISAAHFKFLINLQFGGYRNILTGDVYEMKAIYVNAFQIEDNYNDDEEKLAVFAFRCLDSQYNPTNFFNNIFPTLAPFLKTFMLRHVIEPTIAQTFLKKAPWPYAFNPEVVSTLMPFVNILRPLVNHHSSVLMYYDNIHRLSASETTEEVLLRGLMDAEATLKSQMPDSGAPNAILVYNMNTQAPDNAGNGNQEDVQDFGFNPENPEDMDDFHEKMCDPDYDPENDSELGSDSHDMDYVYKDERDM